jgi:ABC-2 type transport system permease protein
MRVNLLKAYIKKELTEIVRTRLIAMAYLLPLLILVVFGFGIHLNVTHARTVIIDRDNTPLSLRLIDAFEHSKYFDTTVMATSDAKALQLIKRAKTDVLIIIPSSFEKKILKGVQSEIGVYIDGAFPTRASTIESYVQSVILSAQNTMEKGGESVKGMRIVLDYRTLFNQAMKDYEAIVPGLIGLILLVAPSVLAALLIVREKERGTIFNFYASSLNKIEFIVAKLLPAVILHSVNIVLLFLLAVYLFNIPFRGSFWLYWFVSELYLLISISIGLLISIMVKRQVVAIVVTIIVTILPGFLYSGMLMPISSMQKESYIEAHLFPVMYFNHIMYDTFLIGQGLASTKNIEYIGILILYFCVLFTLGTLLLKKEIRI